MRFLRMIDDFYQMEVLSIVKKENKRMNAQMESVLQMSMMDKEELTLDKSSMNIAEVLGEAVQHSNWP